MKIKAPDALLAAEVSRRGLMKTTAIGGPGAGQQRTNVTFYPTVACCRYAGARQ